MTGLPVRLACELAKKPVEQRFLVEHLWSAGAVGIVGGEPKCCKSFLALDIALAVASGRPCLRRFGVHEPGPVLLFAAEDALHIVRERLEGIAAAARIGLPGLPLHVITAPGLRLDLDGDRRALRQTVAQLRPRLLVLDPFVRLHRKNENAADEVAPMLAYLRQLQREHETSVLLVHHARKGGHARPGQALRGSSELHAWGDSNLYLRRTGERLTMTIEHRAAASPPPLTLALRAEPGLALQVVDPAPSSTVPPCPLPTDRLLAVLHSAVQPMTRRQLRDACRMRSSSVGEALATLVADGLVVEDEHGYAAAARVSR
ncbi:MAG: AAA family ATPase [Myxococcales bacterium]|nr:AAA family ATPase [Myxococcales bacterium]